MWISLRTWPFHCMSSDFWLPVCFQNTIFSHLLDTDKEKTTQVSSLLFISFNIFCSHPSFYLQEHLNCAIFSSRVELRPLCLPGKCFCRWATSPAPGICFSPLCGLSFHSVRDFFCVQKFFTKIRSRLWFVCDDSCETGFWPWSLFLHLCLQGACSIFQQI